MSPELFKFPHREWLRVWNVFFVIHCSIGILLQSFSTAFFNWSFVWQFPGSLALSAVPSSIADFIRAPLIFINAILFATILTNLFWKLRNSRHKILLTFATIILACLFVLGAAVFYLGYVEDYSPLLTNLARTGKPIIDQATSFYLTNGRAPTDKELRVLVNDPRLASRHNDDHQLSNGIVSSQYPHDQEWWYDSFPTKERSDRDGYSMTLQMYHDCGLRYDFDGKRGSWIWQTDDIDGFHPIRLNL